MKKDIANRVASLCERSESLFALNCLPENIDIFHARTDKTILEDLSFSLGSVHYQAIDSGGARRVGEELYLPADYILFTVALSGYCRWLPDDSTVASGSIAEAMKRILTCTRIK